MKNTITSTSTADEAHAELQNEQQQRLSNEAKGTEASHDLNSQRQDVESAHSPLPWHVEYHAARGDHVRVALVSRDARFVNGYYVVAADDMEIRREQAIADYQFIRHAIAERDELRRQLQAWFNVFGTSQLTHASARLEAAEEACRGVAIMLNAQLERYDSEPWAQRVRAVANRQDTKSSEASHNPEGTAESSVPHLPDSELLAERNRLAAENDTLYEALNQILQDGGLDSENASMARKAIDLVEKGKGK